MQRVDQHVSHVKGTRHIGRWNDDHERRLTGLNVGHEKTLLFPELHPARLNRLRIVRF